MRLPFDAKTREVGNDAEGQFVRRSNRRLQNVVNECFPFPQAGDSQEAQQSQP
jgi:hypothetical protein